MPSGSLFDELKSSVILPISQGSSELFHSNFLHFIAERCHGYFSKVLSDLIGSHIGYRTVAREYKHTDLSFFDVDIEQYKKENKTPVPVLLIENKMKSLPSREQLDDYLEKLMLGLDAGSSRNRTVLLLPFTEQMEEPGGFRIVTYQKLGASLLKHITLLDDDFLREFVERYARFCINLTRALDSLISPDLASVTVLDYFDVNNWQMQQFERLRLSSIAWKLRMRVLSKELKARLKGVDLEINHNPRQYNRSKSSLRILIGESISNRKPIVECFMPLDEETEFFIQLDNGNYNHGITIKNDIGEAIKIKRKSEKAEAKRNLLQSLPAGSLQKELIDKLGIDIDNFRSYNNMFYSDVGDVGQLTLTDVIDKMKNEILDIYKSFQSMRNI